MKRTSDCIQGHALSIHGLNRRMSFFEGEVVNLHDTWLFQRNRDTSQNLETRIVTDPYTDRRADTCRFLSVHGKHQRRQYMIGPIGPSRIRYRSLEPFSKNDAFTIRVIVKPFRNSKHESDTMLYSEQVTNPSPSKTMPSVTKCTTVRTIASA